MDRIQETEFRRQNLRPGGVTPFWILATVFWLLFSSIASAQNPFQERYGGTTPKPKPVPAGRSTNAAPVRGSNYVIAAENFRRVHGQLYNTDKSVLWEYFTTTVDRKTKGLVLLNTYQEKTETYTGGNGNLTSQQRNGAYSGGPGLSQRTYKYREPGKRIAVTNLTSSASLTTGQDIYIQAMQTGTVDVAGDTLELWDVGTVNRVPLLNATTAASTNKVTGKK